MNTVVLLAVVKGMHVVVAVVERSSFQIATPAIEMLIADAEYFFPGGLS